MKMSCSQSTAVWDDVRHFYSNVAFLSNINWSSPVPDTPHQIWICHYCLNDGFDYVSAKKKKKKAVNKNSCPRPAMIFLQKVDIYLVKVKGFCDHRHRLFCIISSLVFSTFHMQVIMLSLMKLAQTIVSVNIFSSCICRPQSTPSV